MTIDQVGNNVVATSNAGGEFNLAINPMIAALAFASGEGFDSGFYESVSSFNGPTNFGSVGQTFTSNSSGPTMEFNFSANQLVLPPGYTSGAVLAVSTNIFNNASFTSLGITPGTFTWTWGNAPDQSFTIIAVPGPIVGAGLPGLIAALGGLVAMARRCRKLLA